ncbi:MAG: hypothetical protein QOI56_2075, partial [Actinomycetota bacterium]|nr:hypothetical protein [Actinomycetota bacterium]
MADQRSDGDPSASSEPVPLVVVPEEEPDEPSTETISQPAKVIRIGAMTKELLEEVRRAELDEASRSRLKEIFETSVRELAEGISPDLREELSRLTLPFDDGVPSDAELRVAQAQLVGWLEGLFQGIQAAMFTKLAPMALVEEARRRGLPVGPPGLGRPGPDVTRPG